MFFQIASALLLGLISTCIYRLVLSPLARAQIPGPWLAAVTGLYEMYYDLYQEGQFPWVLKKLHEQYGPIIRIAPDQVHIDDTSFVTTYFQSPALRDRYEPYTQQLGVPNATTSTADAKIHRHRRAALVSFISSRVINSPQVSDLIRSKLNLLGRHLTKVRNRGTSIDLRLALWQLASDIITDFAFDDPMNLLKDEELDPSIMGFQTSGQRVFLWFKHFPVLWTLLKSIPPATLVWLAPATGRLLDWEQRQRNRLSAAIDRREALKANVGERSLVEREPSGIFEHLLASTAISEDDKAWTRVWEEGTSLLGAGVATVGNTICVIMFHLLNRRETWIKLKQELSSAFPDDRDMPAAARDLIDMPYLSAVVLEGQRLAVGVISRFARVSPDSPVKYQKYLIPHGTAVCMSTYLVNMNSELFPAPEEWKPERWLASTNKGHGQQDPGMLRDRLLTFSKGPRTCAGIHLANAEIFSTVAFLVRKYDLQLFETTRRDVDPSNDSLLVMAPKDSKGVRVKVM